MEILVTIIAFWLILVGAYGAYSLTQERGRERAPRVREPRPVKLQAATAGAGPFGPVSLPAERVPSFIARSSASASADAIDDIDEQLGIEEDESDRFAAERIVAARLQAREQGEFEAPEPVYEVPRPSMPQYVEPEAEPVRPAARYEAPRQAEPETAPVRPAAPRETPRVDAGPAKAPRGFELPDRPRPTEVDFLRAQVENLRSEIYAMSSDQPAGRQDRPKQRRYRTGNYTHLPRKLTRQVNEARGRYPNE
jgi:hypothetical protein